MPTLTYLDLNVEVLWQSPEPNELCCLAADMTMKKISPLSDRPPKEFIATNLLRANHTSLFEHGVISFGIENISRSLLAQISRHRMASITSASQHYQKYNVYPDIVCEEMSEISDIEEFFNQCNEVYNDLIAHGIPKEEARQVLPNAKAVNIIWTINARSLINFLNLRLCKRNVPEMINFANDIHDLAVEWWPELFEYIGPDCQLIGYCRQGTMQAKVCKAKLKHLRPKLVGKPNED